MSKGKEFFESETFINEKQDEYKHAILCSKTNCSEPEYHETLCLNHHTLKLDEKRLKKKQKQMKREFNEQIERERFILRQEREKNDNIDLERLKVDDYLAYLDKIAEKTQKKEPDEVKNNFDIDPEIDAMMNGKIKPKRTKMKSDPNFWEKHRDKSSRPPDFIPKYGSTKKPSTWSDENTFKWKSKHQQDQTEETPQEQSDRTSKESKQQGKKGSSNFEENSQNQSKKSNQDHKKSNSQKPKKRIYDPMFYGTEDSFFILGIEPTTDRKLVRAAFHKSALEAHPDKGGSNEMYVAVDSAYRKIMVQVNLI